MFLYASCFQISFPRINHQISGSIKHEPSEPDLYEEISKALKDTKLQEKFKNDKGPLYFGEQQDIFLKITRLDTSEEIKSKVKFLVATHFFSYVEPLLHPPERTQFIILILIIIVKRVAVLRS